MAERKVEYIRIPPPPRYLSEGGRRIYHRMRIVDPLLANSLRSTPFAAPLILDAFDYRWRAHHGIKGR